jgi:hypothetical protein
MAYKQKGCTPVTAKVQKTTKGGMVQQPLLNMGAPVKMKMTSPAKQGSSSGIAERRQADKQRLVEADKNRYNKKLEQYKKDVAFAEKPLDKKVATDKRGQIAYNTKKRAEAFEKNLYDYDKKTNPSRTKGFNTAKDYAKSKINKGDKPKKDIAIEKVAGGYFGNTLGKDKPKDSNRIDFPIETKKENKKETGNVIKRKKVEAIKPNVEAKTVSMETKSEIALPKKAVEVKNIEKAEKKIDVAENKETRAAKVRAKGEKSLAEGNKDKALRLKRREERILKRAQKKRSQASKAIEPN